ncbi:MAG: hypothetical protein JXR30_01260, partial [Alphaproteobacteria bacterium]|nr:hypothetical protein [Alphaproteobacteria bacterium]
MNNTLIFSLFLILSVFFGQGDSFAQRGSDDLSSRIETDLSSARRARGSGRVVGKRINVGRVAGADKSVPTTKPTDETTFTTDKSINDGTLTNLECVDHVTQCLSANNLCGPGLFGCQDRLVFDINGELDLGSSVAALVANEGAMCADEMAKCQCFYNAEPPSNSNCNLVWEQIVRQIGTSSYDMGECQTGFLSCAKKECGGENYQGCVDLIDTVINPGSADDTIDTLDAGEFLRDWLNNGTNATTSVLSQQLQSLLLQRLARCESSVLSKCNGYMSPFPLPVTGNTDDASRALMYFFQDFARKAEEGLITYQETHAKEKWLKAEQCVDDVDDCMKKYCTSNETGEGYGKCLHEDGTIDEIVTKNFKTFCQQTLIKCSEMRVEVGLPGYAFLQNPGIDGVEAVWEEFLNKKMLAHGTTMATERRELERTLDKLLATAQKECQETGGMFDYAQENLDVYEAKFGEGNQTDDYKGDAGVVHQEA